MKAILDTNIVLYLLGGKLANPLPPGRDAVSVITEMELLSFPAITPVEEAGITEFLSDVTRIDLTEAVRGIAIGLRRAHRLKLPDAIVAASALSIGTELLTNDDRLAMTPGIQARSLDLK